MSVLKVDAIQDTSGNDQYTAKAWINFNQTGTQSIYADGNCSSITDIAVGRSHITFSNSMSSANYAVCTGSTEYDLDGNSRVHTVVRGDYDLGSTQTTSVLPLGNSSTYSTSTFYDYSNSYAVVFE